MRGEEHKVLRRTLYAIITGAVLFFGGPFVPLIGSLVILTGMALFIGSLISFVVGIMLYRFGYMVSIITFFLILIGLGYVFIQLDWIPEFVYTAVVSVGLLPLILGLESSRW